MLTNIQTIVGYSFSLKDLENADAMGHVRIVGPYSQAGIQILPGIINERISLEQIEQADAVVIQRNFPFRYGKFRRIVEQARNLGKPIIFEIDDLLFHLPENHPDRQAHSFTASLLPMFQAIMEADLVTVPTVNLQQVLSNYAKNVVVYPNYLDDNLWQLNPPRSRVKSDKELIIGYMGTASHAPDLLAIQPVLLEILEQHPNVTVHFWGIKPPDEILSLSQARWFPFYSMSYREFADYFQSQAADIFIAPLTDNLFNRCKSPLKFFEYTALGVPGVYSAVEPYSSIIQHGKTGFLATTLAEWREYLEILLNDEQGRVQLTLNAQSQLMEKWLLSQNSSHLTTILQQIYTQSPANEYRKPVREMMDIINLQQTDMNEILEQELFKNDKEISELKAQLEQLKSEVLSYALSRSWRLTRPFRKLGKMIKHSRGNTNV